MKNTQETLHNGIDPSEYARIPHMIYAADFNTNHPTSNHVDRIASEIDRYLKWKRKYMEVNK